ncbi:MAG: hypothetical protein KDA96_20340 [Planctomycetaceae bacterium]|nr:hypothetical protein [Planctomycetaceae bacterium]
MATNKKSLVLLMAVAFGVTPFAVGGDLIIRPLGARPTVLPPVTPPAGENIQDHSDGQTDGEMASEFVETSPAPQKASGKPRSVREFAEECAVVQVTWLSTETRLDPFRKPLLAHKEFSETCTEVEWELSQTALDSNAAKTEKPTDTQAIAPVNETILQELKSLLSKSGAEQQANTAERSPASSVTPAAPITTPATTIAPAHDAVNSPPAYLADLRSLVREEKPWVCLNQDYAVAHPEETKAQEPSYLQELSAMNAKIVRLHPQVARNARDMRKFPVALVNHQTDTSKSGDLNRLFPPLGSVPLQTSSVIVEQSSQRGDASPFDSLEKKQLSSDASEYVDTTAPRAYFTRLTYGVVRPNRSPYAFRHNPLYFEDPNLERCGRSSGCLTTLVSAGHFTFNTLILPYRVAAQPPYTCVNSPGDCPTCFEYGSDAYLPGWSWKGAIAEAGVVTGLVFVIP